MYKISYKLNILSYVNEYIEEDLLDGKNKFFFKSLSLLKKCTESDELDLFVTESLTDVLDFKWNQYAIKFHMIGCLMHFGYMFLLFVYIYEVYIMNSQENKLIMDIVLCCGLVYPLCYEIYQLKRYGAAIYFSDFNNVNDGLYCFAGIFNLFSQQVSHSWAFHNKCCLTMICIQ